MYSKTKGRMNHEKCILYHAGGAGAYGVQLASCSRGFRSHSNSSSHNTLNSTPKKHKILQETLVQDGRRCHKGQFIRCVISFLLVHLARERDF